MSASAPLPQAPLERFLSLLESAKAVDPVDYNAMTLATVSPEGRPSARIVLLKDADARGFVFYTNLESQKGRELRAHPVAALCFYWPKLEQQVRVEGPVHPVSNDEADAYFATRPRGSQVGAWASRQSQPLESRQRLEARVRDVEARFEGQPIPRPPHWSGFVLTPERIEFWKAGAFRLHERWVYTGSPTKGWKSELLFP